MTFTNLYQVSDLNFCVYSVGETRPRQEQQASKADRPQSGDQMDTAGFNIDDIIQLDVIPGNIWSHWSLLFVASLEEI